MNFKQRSPNSKRIIIHRMPLSLRYTNRSACTAAKNLVFSGVFLFLFFCHIVVVTYGRHFNDLQVTLMLRVLEHFSLMRGHPGREMLS